MENQKQIDKKNLRQIILDFPKQFAEGLSVGSGIKQEGKFNSVTISGMGGSALIGDMLKNYFLNEEIALSICQNRSYKLPPEAFEKSLNFISSYSGNTEETLAVLAEALEKNLPVVGFSAGGELARIFTEKKLPLAFIPSGIEPRLATGYFFGAMTKVLANCQLFPDISSKLLALESYLDNTNPELENQGQLIAQKIKSLTPVIYASENFSSVAKIWKININENAKTPAFWNVFPELNHNEMVGWTLPQSKFHILSLIFQKDHPRVIERMRLTKELLAVNGLEMTLIEIPGTSTLESLFSGWLLGEWVSYYLALAYDQDPTPVRMVEEFKKMLT